MWYVNGYNLQMCEGDFGLELPVTFSDVTLDSADEIKLTIKKTVNGTALIEKTFSNITENTINLVLTDAESALLPVGSYVYALDWYQDGQFLCNAIPIAALKVVEKA